MIEEPFELKDFDFSSISFETAENGDFQMSEEVLTAWKKHGFFIVRHFLDASTITAVENCAKGDAIQNKPSKWFDSTGATFEMSLWNNLDNGICGAIARSRKVVEPLQTVLGGKVYHYHSKLVMKNSKGSGAFNWHQDYGYWYNNGCLLPDMATLWLPLDRVDKGNSCLKLIPGSHKCGRIDHIDINGQVSAQEERVDALVKKNGFVYANMSPGDCLFFHCNVLHSSEQNLSGRRRWALILSYNTVHNDPVYKHHLPNAFDMEMWENEKIKENLENYGTNYQFIREGKVVSHDIRLGEDDMIAR